MCNETPQSSRENGEHQIDGFEAPMKHRNGRGSLGERTDGAARRPSLIGQATSDARGGLGRVITCVRRGRLCWVAARVTCADGGGRARTKSIEEGRRIEACASYSSSFATCHVFPLDPTVIPINQQAWSKPPRDFVPRVDNTSNGQNVYFFAGCS